MGILRADIYMKTKHRHYKKSKSKTSNNKTLKTQRSLWHAHHPYFTNGPEGLFAEGRGIETCIDNMLSHMNAVVAVRYGYSGAGSGPYGGPWARQGYVVKINDNYYEQHITEPNTAYSDSFPPLVITR